MDLSRFHCRCCGACSRIRDGICRVSDGEIVRIALSSAEPADGPPSKVAIRRAMRLRRKALSSEAKERAADEICAKILALPRAAGAVAVYLASPDEIDLTAAIEALLARGVALVAPRWNGETYVLVKLKGLRPDDLRTGPMGIREPCDAETVPPRDVALWLVPGLAFTRDGGRLGYGGGWYDRLMASADVSAQKLGVAYSFQVVEDLPCEPHDIRLDGLVCADCD